MFVPKQLALTVGSLALILGGSMTADAHDDSARAPVVGHVYANDNTAGMNTIGAFDRHADGTLTPTAGTPFAAGGAGTGAPLGSQGSLQLAGHGRFLLAADAGSNQISVLRIADDGGLTPVNGSPVSSNGIEPISIAVHDDLVYVANEGNGSSGSNYTGFRLAEDGKLTPISGSTISLPGTALPGDILFNSTGKNLIAPEVGPSLIDSYLVGNDGLLSKAPGSPFAAQGVGPFGSEFRPTDASELYVSNAHGGANAGSVSAFDVNARGVLKSIGDSPFADLQTAPCWVEITHDGKFLFTINTAVPSISSYRILSDGSLSLIGSTVFNNPTGRKPFDARLDPSGKTLYVVDAGFGTVSAFDVDGGNLKELKSSPFKLPAGATPFGLVVTGGDRDR